MGSRNPEDMIVSHLLFADDDKFIFCEPNCEELRNLRYLFLML